MPTDDIRTTDPVQFVLQDWLVEKISASNVAATRQEIAEKVTAEWAKPVDLSFKQINEAFNGHPVHALRVGASALGSASATTTGLGADRTKTLLLAKDIPASDFVYLSLTLRVSRTAATNAVVVRHAALYANLAGTIVQRAVDQSHSVQDPNDDLLWLTGATTELPAAPADAGANNLALRVTGPSLDESIVWSAEFTVASGPLGLPASSLIGI